MSTVGAGKLRAIEMETEELELKQAIGSKMMQIKGLQQVGPFCSMLRWPLWR